MDEYSLIEKKYSNYYFKKFEPAYLLHTEDEKLDGRIITINGKKLINFASCSYFGLELDERLKKRAIEATQKYGTQFSMSKSFVSLGLYKDLFEIFSKLFQTKNIVITPTVTLGHLAVIPVIIEDNDFVIFDQQVHASVQLALDLLHKRKIKTKKISHNNYAHLEKTIKRKSRKYRRIWYFADGVHSVYGDVANVAILEKLQKKYKKLYLYLDDAHGTSVAGKNGSGIINDRIETKTRKVICMGHAKCFGAAGGTFIFDNEFYPNLITGVGSTLIFAMPITPPILGALIASAKIHLSDEIYSLQKKLQKKIKFTIDTFKKLNIALSSEEKTPIHFVKIDQDQNVIKIFEMLINKGFYVNPFVYPAIGKNAGGIRFTNTVFQTEKDIFNLATAFKNIFESLEF